MSLSVCLFPNSCETAEPIELKFPEIIPLIYAKRISVSVNHLPENWKNYLSIHISFLIFNPVSLIIVLMYFYIGI